MSKHDARLDDLLKCWRVPERREEYWDEFPSRVSQAIQAKRTVHRLPERPAQRWCWRVGFVAVCLALMAFLVLWKKSDADRTAADLASIRKIYGEVSAMFPNQVQALVFTRQGVRVELAEKPSLPSSAPLLLDICESPRHCARVITFSGRQVDFANERFEVLIDSKGTVNLVGDRWVWSSDQAQRVASHFHIKARPLAVAL